MKADLYTAPARTAGSLGLAHRTAAGFVVLTSADGDDMIALIDDNQNEPDLIDKVVGAAQAGGAAAFAMIFTAGGDLYAIVSGAAGVTITSSSAQILLGAAPGNVLVQAVNAGLNETDAVLRLHVGEVPPGARTDTALKAGTVEADWVEVAVGGAELAASDSATEAPAPADPGEDVVLGGAQPTAAEVPFASDASAGEVVAESLASTEETPATEAELVAEPVTDASTPPVPEPPVPAPAPAAEAPAPAPIPEPPVPTPTPAAEAPAPAPIPEPPVPTPTPAAEAPAPAPIPEPPVPAPTPAAEAPAPTEPTPAPEPTASEAPAEPGKVGAVMVLGVACSQGHHNHPDAVYCSQCGTKMGVHHTTVLINGPRPPLGVLVVDDGTTYSLNQDLVIGREPSSHADVIAGTASPMVLTDDTLSLSRKHARIVLDDWSVGVEDLHSSNGTYLSRAGQAESWTKVEPTGVLSLEPGDRLRVGGRIIQVELHHVR